MSTAPHHVLFICTGNSARSILAEAILNKLGTGRFKAWSAGSHPKGSVHPLALEWLAQMGMGEAGLRSKSWDEFTTPDASPLSVVITVCDSAAGEACPVFFGAAGQPVKVHWGYPDPSDAPGGDEAQRRAFELTRQAIGYRMLQLLALPLQTLQGDALKEALDGIARS